MKLFSHTWRHIRRSPFQSLIAFTTIFVSFFVFTIFLFLNFGLSSLLSHFESKPEITIFLKDGLSKSTLDSVQADLSSYPDVKEIRYVSKETALNIYKDLNKDNPLLTEMVTSSILPASFEVSAKNPKALELIAQNYTAKSEIVDEIVYQKDIIQSLLFWTNLIRRFGIISIIVLGSISFFMIFIIIGLKITNRKDEINISRLLGASQFYVKKPFLLEGTLYGAIGSFLAYLTVFLVFLNFKNKINSFFKPIVFVSQDPLFYLFSFAIEVSLGIAVGLLASFMVSRRYIKW